MAVEIPARHDGTAPAASAMVMRVFAYGTPYWADPGGEAITQLRLANRLWNRLVEIEREHEGAKAAIWLRDTAVAEATAAVTSAQETLAAVKDQMLAARVRDRSTIPRRADAARLDEARQAVASSKKRLEETRKAAAAGLRPEFADARRQRAAAIKATYAEYVQAAGLGWGTYNDIVRRRFPAAVARVEAAGRTPATPARRLHVREKQMPDRPGTKGCPSNASAEASFPRVPGVRLGGESGA